MQRRRFLTVLTLAGSATLLSACDDMPASAVAPWSGPEPEQTVPRLRALAWALLAPNPHNMQPWIADLREAGVISLRLDTALLLPATDPPGRQILIGCGAFLELLEMGAAREGWSTQTQLFPEGAFDEHRLDGRNFVRIRFTRQSSGQLVDPLFAHAQARRTNRLPYSEQMPSQAALSALQAAISPGVIQMKVVSDAAQVKAISALAAQGYRVEGATPAAIAESARVVRLGAEAIAAEPSGIAVNGPSIWWARKLGLASEKDAFDPDSAGNKQVLARFVDAMAATPVWFWLSSADNSRATQMAAGRAYLRLTLAATGAGLATHPNSQVLQEFPEMAALYRQIHDLTGVRAPGRLQMLVRVGMAPQVGPAPRRPVAKLLRA